MYIILGPLGGSLDGFHYTINLATIHRIFSLKFFCIIQGFNTLQCWMLHIECSNMPVSGSGQLYFRCIVEFTSERQKFEAYLFCCFGKKYSMHNKQFIHWYNMRTTFHSYACIVSNFSLWKYLCMLLKYLPILYVDLCKVLFIYNYWYILVYNNLTHLQVVYIGVQGQSSTSTFTILVWDQLFDPVDAFIDLVEGAHRGETIYEVNRNLTRAAQGNT